MQNNDTERALDWLFSHPDDTGVEEATAGPKPIPGGKMACCLFKGAIS